MKRILKSLLPVFGAAIIYLNYFLVPSYNIFKTTLVYPALVGVYVLVYAVRYLLYLKKPDKLEALIHVNPRMFAVAIALTLWDFLTLKTGILKLPFFPWIDKVLNVYIVDWQILGLSVLYSLRLLLLGYIIGGGIGLITGVLIGWSKTLNYWIMPIAKLIGPIPAVAWIPIVLVLAPTTFVGSVFLIALAVWFPTTLMTSSGISGVRNAYFEVARTLGAKEKYLVLNVAIPAALPNVFLGLFQGIGVACVTLISAEMIGVKAGLGWYISWSTGWAEYHKVFASIILILITFTSVITLIFKVRDKFLAWQKGVIKW